MPKSLICIIVSVLIMPILTADDAFASPSFNRQEVKDVANDWSIKSTGSMNTLVPTPDGKSFQIPNAKNVEDCIKDGAFEIPDIEAISYLSTGNTLEITAWLSAPFKTPVTNGKLSTPESFREIPWHYVGYTASIDIVSAYDAGPDYYATIKWDPVSQKWLRVLEEGSASTGQKRLLEESEAVGFYDAGKNHILFSVPLEKIGSPQQYNLLLSAYDIFMQNDQLCYLVDVGNWVQVPPPEFVITTTPNPILLRPGEQASVEIQVKSLTSVKSNVQLALAPTNGLTMNLPSSEAYVPPLGVGTLLLEVTTTDDVKYRTYTIPVYANHTFLTSSKLRGGDYVQNQISTSTSDVSNIVVSVSPPLTPEERFGKFWGTYGAVIGIVASAAVSVIIAPIVKKRIDERKKDTELVKK